MRGLILVLMLPFGFLLSGQAVWGASFAESPWRTYALGLNSENESELKKAKEALAAIPDLDRGLAEVVARGPEEDRRAAYEVIASLRRQALLGDLLKRAATETGAEVFRAIRGLIPSAGTDSKEISAAFQASLFRSGESVLSAGAKVVILSGLRELQERISPDQIGRLLSEKNSQVRISAISLAGDYRVTRALESYDEPLVSALRMKPYQLRLEALRWVARTPTASPLRRRLGACRDDPNAEVRNLCRKAAIR